MAVRRTGFVRARKAAGFTQESFPHAMDVDRSTVARWEQGACEPLPYLRSKPARLLNITMSELDKLLSPQMESVAVTRHINSHDRAEQVDPAPAQPLRAPTVPVAMRELITFRTVSEAFQLADRKIEGGVLYGQVVRFLQDEVAPKLLAPPSGVSHHEVFSAAASFSEFAGWTAHDSGHDRQAKVHLTQAYHLATTAQNLQLSSNVLASLTDEELSEFAFVPLEVAAARLRPDMWLKLRRAVEAKRVGVVSYEEFHPNGSR